MPLVPGNTPKVVSQNISELTHSATKRPHKQIIAIALNNARRTSGKRIGFKKSK